MKFKVGDKVRCIGGQADVLKIGEVYTVYLVEREYIAVSPKSHRGDWLCERFELVKEEPQGIKVGDVWSSEDKSRVVRVVAKFERNDITWISFLRLNGEYKGLATYDRNELFATKFPLLLHRPPKKQPKPQQEKPKKQEEVWERIFQSNEDYRCGNKIKVIYQGYEGLAVCNKHDKFDLMFGVNLAAHRAMVKYHQKVIDEMIKEGVK